MLLRDLGRTDYAATWQAMRAYTDTRDADTPDALWLTEHDPVYTLGVAGRGRHAPRLDNGIPLVQTDRGGLITYHGPGQIVVYVLLDLRRRGLLVRELVKTLEQAVIDLLQTYGVKAARREQAPGVYVDGAKIAALGLRIRRGCCYHGLALNVTADLAPFAAIDPCGYAGMAVTRTRDLGITDTQDRIKHTLARELMARLELPEHEHTPG